MEIINIDDLSREKARDLIKKLPRNKEFLIEKLSDDRRMFIRTDGIKTSLENGKEIKDIDITVHYDGEPKRKISYINDIFVPLIKIEILVRNSKFNFSEVIEAIKESIELKSVKEILKKHSTLFEFEKVNPTGCSIEFLLVLIKMLALQEDINYWGINPKTKKKYEGREKPYNALYDLLVKKMPLTHVTRKHMLY